MTMKTFELLWELSNVFAQWGKLTELSIFVYKMDQIKLHCKCCYL